MNSAQLTVVSGGPIIARLTNEDGQVAEHTLVVADVAGGDLDGDSVDELVFAGLEEVITQCSVEPPANGLKHALVGLGNHFNNFAQIGASVYFNRPAGCADHAGILYRFVHANVLDFDGDGDNDIQANDFVFEGFKQNQPDAPLSQLHRSAVRILLPQMVVPRDLIAQIPLWLSVISQVTV
ncbi:MAG: hypothetical protein KUG53_03100 [Pseudomonadales bacterium]|nr:hypothetical protein [Pseudomonadales bacterium]